MAITLTRVEWSGVVTRLTLELEIRGQPFLHQHLPAFLLQVLIAQGSSSTSKRGGVVLELLHDWVGYQPLCQSWAKMVEIYFTLKSSTLTPTAWETSRKLLGMKL